MDNIIINIFFIILGILIFLLKHIDNFSVGGKEFVITSETPNVDYTPSPDTLVFEGDTVDDATYNDLTMQQYIQQEGNLDYPGGPDNYILVPNEEDVPCNDFNSVENIYRNYNHLDGISNCDQITQEMISKSCDSYFVLNKEFNQFTSIKCTDNPSNTSLCKDSSCTYNYSIWDNIYALDSLGVIVIVTSIGIAGICLICVIAKRINESCAGSLPLPSTANERRPILNPDDRSNSDQGFGQPSRYMNDNLNRGRVRLATDALQPRDARSQRTDLMDVRTNWIMPRGGLRIHGSTQYPQDPQDPQPAIQPAATIAGNQYLDILMDTTIIATDEPITPTQVDAVLDDILTESADAITVTLPPRPPQSPPRMPSDSSSESHTFPLWSSMHGTPLRRSDDFSYTNYFENYGSTDGTRDGSISSRADSLVDYISGERGLPSFLDDTSDTSDTSEPPRMPSDSSEPPDTSDTSDLPDTSEPPRSRPRMPSDSSTAQVALDHFYYHTLRNTLSTMQTGILRISDISTRPRSSSLQVRLSPTTNPEEPSPTTNPEEPSPEGEFRRLRGLNINFIKQTFEFKINNKITTDKLINSIFKIHFTSIINNQNIDLINSDNNNGISNLRLLL